MRYAQRRTAWRLSRYGTVVWLVVAGRPVVSDGVLCFCMLRKRSWGVGCIPAACAAYPGAAVCMLVLVELLLEDERAEKAAALASVW